MPSSDDPDVEHEAAARSDPDADGRTCDVRPQRRWTACASTLLAVRIRAWFRVLSFTDACCGPPMLTAMIGMTVPDR